MRRRRRARSAPVLRRFAGPRAPPAVASRLSAVLITISEQSVEVRLSRWQKVLGLLRDVTVARSQISEVAVEQEPVRVAMGAGMKVGLRLPWFYYVARTLRLDEVFVVRRGVPALSFAVSGEGPLRRVLVSTPDADALAQALRE